MTTSPQTHPAVPGSIAKLATAANTVEFFTGAGMSAESGLETFRDKQTGLWSKVDPIAMANFDAWRRDPSRIWPWYLWRMSKVQNATPNAGHIAIAKWTELLSDGPGWGHVTTQNIDNLHERAGSDHVAHLHGSLFAFRCDHCGAPAEQPDPPREPVEKLMPPLCERCVAGLIHPGVVWFGESLPQAAWMEAEMYSQKAELMIVTGTSGVVFPAAGLPLAAVEAGIPVVEISPEETDFTPHATHFWQTTAAVGLPALVDVVKKAREQ